MLFRSFLNDKTSATALIFCAAVVGLLWAFIQFSIIAKIPVQSGGGSGEQEGLISSGDDEAISARLNEIYTAIYEGAESFLKAEYTVCFWFVLAFAILILVLVSWGTGWDMARGSMTAISFLLGAFTSMASGYLGMKVAVYSNVRTTVSAQKPGWTACFNTAFRAGAVMGKQRIQCIDFWLRLCGCGCTLPIDDDAASQLNQLFLRSIR
jgi:inorganic pyrophosphatase